MTAELQRQARARYEHRRRKAAEAGQPFTTPPDRARAHILMLVHAGFQRIDIARAAGVGPTIIGNILSTDGHIYAVTERRILACTQQVVAGSARRVPTTIPTRMVRALTRLGWGPGEIARMATVSVMTVRTIRDNPRPRIQRETAELIGAAYDRMVVMPQPGGDYANQMRAHARNHGWAAPTTDGWTVAA